MAVFNTHQAFQALMAAGFSERQAQALIDVGSEGYGALATKADVADMATKADIADMATRADLHALELSTKAELREMELRIRLYVGTYVAIAAALVVAILGFLLALFTGQFE